MKKCIWILAMTAATSLAQPYSFHQQPTDQSPIIFKAQDFRHVVPIYFSKHGWVEVGHEQDGQIGWIRKEQLGSLVGTQKQYHQRFHRKVATKDNKHRHEETIEVIGPKLITRQQAEQMQADILERQARMHAHMAKMMHHMDEMFADVESEFWGIKRSDYEHSKKRLHKKHKQYRRLKQKLNRGSDSIDIE